MEPDAVPQRKLGRIRQKNLEVRWHQLAERMADPREDPRELYLAQEGLMARTAITAIRPRTQTGRRESHGRSPGHRRTTSASRGAPPGESDADGPGEAGLNLTALWRIYEQLIASLVGLVLTRFRLEAVPA